MGEKWMDRVKRVYKEKKDKDPNYKYSQAMSDAKIGYVADGVTTAKPAKTHRAKKQKGGSNSTRIAPQMGGVVPKAPAPPAGMTQMGGVVPKAPAPPAGMTRIGGKSRKNKKSRKSRRGGKAKKSRKRK